MNRFKDSSQITDHRSLVFEITITGESMWPVLIPGKRYRARSDQEPTVGDIVVAKHPADPRTTIVKRVKSITVHGSLFTVYELAGTVSWSSTFTVDKAAILGVVVCDKFDT